MEANVDFGEQKGIHEEVGQSINPSELRQVRFLVYAIRQRQPEFWDGEEAGTGWQSGGHRSER